MTNLKIPRTKLPVLFGSSLFIGVGLLTIWWALASVTGASRLGEVTPERGGVYFITPDEKKERIAARSVWRAGHSVTTDDIGRARVSLADGSIWDLSEGTQLQMVELGKGQLLRVRTGKIEPLLIPQGSMLRVQLPDGQILMASDYSATSSAADSLPQSAIQASNLKITQEQIQNAVQRLRPQILRCYSAFLQESSDRAKYAITARMSYASRGGVQDLQLSATPRLEQKLEACLLTVLKALNLSPYQGPTIDIELPIELE